MLRKPCNAVPSAARKCKTARQYLCVKVLQEIHFVKGQGLHLSQLLGTGITCKLIC